MDHYRPTLPSPTPAGTGPLLERMRVGKRVWVGNVHFWKVRVWEEVPACQCDRSLWAIIIKLWTSHAWPASLCPWPGTQEALNKHFWRLKGRSILLCVLLFVLWKVISSPSKKFSCQSWPWFSLSDQPPNQVSIQLTWSRVLATCICSNFVLLFFLLTHPIPPCGPVPCALGPHAISPGLMTHPTPCRGQRETRAEVRAGPWTILDRCLHSSLRFFLQIGEFAI